MHLGPIDERPARPVGYNGAFLPAVPQALADVDELPGALVAHGLFHVRLAAEVERSIVVGGGDDVPAGAATAQIVERALRDDATILLARRQHVAHEHQVELAALGRLGGAAVVVVAEDVLRLNGAMPPSRDMVPAGIGKDAEMHPSLCHVSSP